MPKLPQVSGNDVIRLLTSLGYEVLRQRGSHVRLRKSTPLGEHNITVPVHGVLAKGTLSDILNRTSLWNNILQRRIAGKAKVKLPNFLLSEQRKSTSPVVPFFLATLRLV